jgi:hypothetical protein
MKQYAYWLGLILMTFTQTTMANNLSQSEFAKNYPIDNVIQLIGGYDDPYHLSIPLLISAALGNATIYHDVHQKMTAAMQKFTQDRTKDSLSAWMYGRMIMAEKYMNEDNPNTLLKLSTFLHNPDTQNDQYKAWAYAYWASLNQKEYLAAKVFMLNLATSLTTLVKPEDISNALWIWVMIIQASANAQDKTTYDLAVDHLLRIAQTKSMRTALEKIPENDFNKWATAIVATSAAKMNKSESLPTLTGNPNSPDYMLAQVTYELAKQ